MSNILEKIKMKIYFNVDCSKRTFEGRTQIARKIKTLLEKRGFEIISDPTKADILHFHSSGIFDSYQAYRLKKKLGKPCVYSLYSLSQAEPIKHFKNHKDQQKITPHYEGKFFLSYSAILPLKLRSWLLAKLDAVVVCSHFSLKKLWRNTHLIRIGIDTTKFIPRKSKGKEKQDTKIQVAYVGHPSATKGILDFIEASRKFDKSIEPHVYVSRLPDELVKLAKKTNSRIQLHDHAKDIVEVYNKIDILVLPFRNKLSSITNPLVLLEAMSCEAAIITTNLKHITEIIQDSVLTVLPYKPKDIAQTVNKLAKNKEEREELGKKARKIVQKFYDEKEMVERYITLYNKIIQK